MMHELTGLKVAVYVTGSVACYKTLNLIRRLKKSGAYVKVIMSRGAERFIQPLTFQAISQSPVIDDRSVNHSSRGIIHVDLARWTDLAIVMPATANVIAKMANGIADGIVSTCLLATSAPKWVVPAMNNIMLENPATQENVKRMGDYPGCHLLGPVYGRLAEGYAGKGRMMEPQQVIKEICRWLSNDRPLKGLNLLITAGGTREPIDPVRFITNGSSGRMGFAIAQRASQLGARVTLIKGHTSVPVPKGVSVLSVRTTEEMERAVLNKFPKHRILIMAAALADFTPAHYVNHKIKKPRSLWLKFRQTPDVLKRVARIKRPDQLTVGFAAETQDLLKNATQKLRAKKLDLIVANDVANPRIGFGTRDNQVTFIDAHGRQKRTAVESKLKVADQLLRIVNKLRDDCF